MKKQTFNNYINLLTLIIVIASFLLFTLFTPLFTSPAYASNDIVISQVMHGVAGAASKEYFELYANGKQKCTLRGK